MKLLLTGAQSLGDPDFVDAARIALGMDVRVEEGESEDVSIEPEELTRLRGYAAEVEVRGGPPPSAYPSPLHYPSLAHIDASRQQTEIFPHLIYVAGSLGVYVPARFDKPVVLPNLTLIGSLAALVDELESLRMHLEKGELFNPEKRAWLALLQAAKRCEVKGLVLGFG